MDTEKSELSEGTEKKLGFLPLTAMVIGSMIGAGIFMIPASFAAVTGVTGAFISWAIAGLGMLTLAFVFQALAVRKPKLEAGVYSYAKEGFGRYTGFVSAIGYWASACAGNVTYIVLINSTLGEFFPALGQGNTILAMVLGSAVVWLFFFLTSRGVQQAAFINTVVTVAKLVPILVFIGFMIAFFDIDTFVANLGGTYPGYEAGLFDQVQATMMVTVFVFIGIEGASVYSRYAKTRKAVGSATVLGFLTVLCLLMLVSIFPMGVLPQETIAGMHEPSAGGILQNLVGVSGGIFISVGIIIAVLGAYLAWTLMAAEVLYTVAQDDTMPELVKKTNKNNAPFGALIFSAGLTQIMLLVSFFSEDALNFALTLTSALALVPYFLSAAFAFKIALKKDGYDDVPSGVRTRELVVAAISTLYILFLIYVAGIHLLPLCCLILAPATIFFIVARKKKEGAVFTKAEMVLFGILCLGAVFAIVSLIFNIG